MNYVKSARRFAIATAFGLSAFAANAQDSSGSEYSWNVTATSDYLFRGISQTDEKPTLQADFAYTSPVGFYAGIWGSGIDLGKGGPDVEIDFRLGYGLKITDRVGFDAKFVRYMYQGESRYFGSLDYNELITTTTLDDTYKLTVAYTNDYLNSGLDDWYVALGGDWELPQRFVLSANLGHSMFEGGGDYTDWSVGVSRKFGMFGVGLGYYGTTGQSRNKLADDRFMLTLSVGQLSD